MRITIKQKENTTNEISTPTINLFVLSNVYILNKLLYVKQEIYSKIKKNTRGHEWKNSIMIIFVGN
ncbi:hypothetical protein [Polaribacter sp.]|uniref:hypothetical protein n=1 Tax=Polaribacter sp. TaxID=1920175 RepID=UPI0040481BAD